MSFGPVPNIFAPDTPAFSGLVNQNFAYVVAEINAILATLGNNSGAPQGRLTLTSGSPVMSANVTDSATVYYAPYTGLTMPLYNGTSVIYYTFSQQTLTLTAGNNVSGKLYDVFAYLSGSTVLIGTGPAWTSNTARSAAITQGIGGIWTNSAAIVLTNGATTSPSIGISQATYLGTIYCDSSAACSMKMTPAVASGGGLPILGVYNAYNRVPTLAQCLDSHNAYTVGTINTWLPYGAGSVQNNNAIFFVDGLQQSNIDAEFVVYIASTGGTGLIGVNLDSATAAPSAQAQSLSSFCANPVRQPFLPQIGLHYLQPMMNGNSNSTVTFGGNPVEQMTVLLPM